MAGMTRPLFYITDQIMKTKILRLNHYHEPTGWCTWKDVIRYQAKDMLVQLNGEELARIMGGKNKLGVQSYAEITSIIIVQGGADRKYRTPALTNERLFMRDLKRCAYCGRQYSSSLLTRDHIIPTAKKGANTWNNCITACKPCNNYKSDYTLEELDLKLRFKPYTPDRIEAMIMQNPQILPEQLELLSMYLPEHSRILEYFELYGK